MSEQPLISSLQVKSLRRSPTLAAYHLYMAALEWGLTDPILIQDRKDLKSESRWRDQIEPFHHQVKNLISFCRRLPVTLLADDDFSDSLIGTVLVVDLVSIYKQN